jgi:hypothetical protein
VLESLDSRGPKGGRTYLGQPITAVRPDGVPPVPVRFWVPKDLQGWHAYRASDEAPPALCLV